MSRHRSLVAMNQRPGCPSCSQGNHRSGSGAPILSCLAKSPRNNFWGDDPADTGPLKDGIWNLRIQIKRVLAGQESRKEIDATLIVHTYLQRDRNFGFAHDPEVRTGGIRVDESETGCEANVSDVLASPLMIGLLTLPLLISISGIRCKQDCFRRSKFSDTTVSEIDRRRAPEVSTVTSTTILAILATLGWPRIFRQTRRNDAASRG